MTTITRAFFAEEEKNCYQKIAFYQCVCIAELLLGVSNYYWKVYVSTFGDILQVLDFNLNGRR